jgi:hypothetical protein
MSSAAGTRTLLLLASLTPLIWPADALSQTTLVSGDEGGAAYGRIRYLEGEVAVTGTLGERAGESLGINSPVLPQDQVATGEGRVEVQLADGSLVRLDRATLLEARALADIANTLEKRTWLLLHAGAAYVYVDRLQAPDESFRVDTPSGSIYFLSEGVFRIDVSPQDGSATVSSHSGVAEVVSEGVSVLVRSGERTDLFPQGRPSDPRAFNPFSQDDFDRWNRSRQAAYVSPYENLPAAEVPAEVQPYVTELAYYGDWVHDADYGWVWRPAVTGTDWSPYLVGRWDYAPGGWLWVSYEPWGWAPYHYGRWAYAVGVGWSWIPGALYGGAWVSWAWGAGTLGWCALNYYNQPVVPVNVYFTHPHRTWVFVPQDKIHFPNLQMAAVPKYHLEPRSVHALDRAPGANPVAVARASGAGRPPAGTSVVTAGDDGQRISFLTLEGRGRYRLERPASRPSAAPTAAPATRAAGMRRGASTVPRDPRAAAPATGAPPASPRPSRPASSLGVRIHNPAPLAAVSRPRPPATTGDEQPPVVRRSPAAGAPPPAQRPPASGAPAGTRGPGQAGSPPSTVVRRAPAPEPAAPGSRPSGQRPVRVIRADDHDAILQRLFGGRAERPAQAPPPRPATVQAGPGAAAANPPAAAQPPAARRNVQAGPAPPQRAAPANRAPAKPTPKGKSDGAAGKDGSGKGGGGSRSRR